MSLRMRPTPILPSSLFLDGCETSEERSIRFFPRSGPSLEYSGSLSKPDNMLPFEPLFISEHAFIPALPVSYVFTPVSTSSTALVTSGASSPLVTITVVCDSLAPELLSTQITRGNQSEVIGEFKTGMTPSFSTISLNRVTKQLADVAGRRGCGTLKPELHWSFDNNPTHQFVWTCQDDGKAVCTRDPARIRCHASLPPLAILHGYRADNMCCESKALEVLPQATLELSPEAHAPGLFEQVLLSAVLVQQRRPSRCGPKKQRA